MLAQLSTLDDECPSPVRVSSSSRGKRSAGTSKGKMARTQSAVKLQPRPNVVGGSEEMESAPAPHAPHSGANKSSSRGQGPSTQVGVGRRTGGKPRGAKTLVLSSCSSGSVTHASKQSGGKRKGVSSKTRARQTNLESSDGVSDEY